jgi:hypothetical protein
MSVAIFAAFKNTGPLLHPEALQLQAIINLPLILALKREDGDVNKNKADSVYADPEALYHDLGNIQEGVTKFTS